MEYVFKAKNLSKRYGKFDALSGVNLEIPKGAIYGFVGKNGAGKTTLIRLMCGLQTPTDGSYEIMGAELGSKEIIKMRHRMGAVVESPAIYKDMTARDNLVQQCLMLGLPDYDNVDDILKLVGLSDTGKKKQEAFPLVCASVLESELLFAEILILSSLTSLSMVLILRVSSR